MYFTNFSSFFYDFLSIAKKVIIMEFILIFNLDCVSFIDLRLIVVIRDIILHSQILNIKTFSKTHIFQVKVNNREREEK